MSDKILKSNIKKTNFFDGQRVSESDLDSNQKYFEDIISSNNLDFHSSGVLKKSMKPRILLDTSKPGYYADDGENGSKAILNLNKFDGLPIYVDIQPKDRVYGKRLEVELSGSSARGREQNVKVILVGLVYDPQYPGGILEYEFINFDDNKTILTENHYFEIKCLIVNNMSNGSGFSDSGEKIKSLNLGGKLVIRESESAKIFSKSNILKNIKTFNFDLKNMYGKVSLSSEINSGVTPTNSVQELYIDYDYELFSFNPNASIGISYGQKFIAQSNNLQKVEVLMSVDKSLEKGTDWRGDLVFSIYELEDSQERRSSNPLDGNPKVSPIAEVSLDQEDLGSKGYSLKEYLSKVEIDFSASNISDPNSGLIERGKGYAFIISRAGNNSYGKVNVAVSDNYLYAKKRSNLNIKIEESYAQSIYEFIEFDPNYSSYISNEEKSLWFAVHSAQFELTSGLIYDANGRVFSIPELADYVAESKINFKLPAIDLASTSKNNIVGVSGSNKFSSPDVHPRTGNFVYTRIENYPQLSVFAEDDATVDKDSLVILGTIKDSTSRDAELIELNVDKPGLLGRDFLYIVNPSSEIILQNLIGRKFVIDEKYSHEYIINKVEKMDLKYGDIYDENRYTDDSLQYILSISGSSITSSETQRSILGGAIDIIDYIKSDLDGDGIIDGSDINYMENAIDGNISFPVGENLNVIKINFEKEVIAESKPEIDSFGPVETAQADTLMKIENVDEKTALLIGVGDELEFTLGLNKGNFIVSSKTIESDGTTVYIGLNNDEGDTAILFAETENYFKIISKNFTNSFLDNKDLLGIPFSNLNSKIYFNEYFQERNMEVCDLRSFLDFSFKEDLEESCECVGKHICGTKSVNQKYLPADLFIEGRIKSSDGKEYSSDYEFANVSVDIPVGTLSGCQIDLYNSFIKSKGNTCLTSTGYPAMKFSDGTYVGCEDIGANTDIKKNRVKITGGIASLHVDAFVDGYAVDEEQGTIEEYNLYDKISEESTNFVYTELDGSGDSYWPRSGFSGNFSVVEPSNGPTEVLLTTHASSSDTSASISNPLEISSVPGVVGDFIYDFEVSRDPVLWEDYLLSNGKVEFFLEFEINNGSSGKSLLKIGYRAQGEETKAFYSGNIYDSSGATLYSFDFEEKTVDIQGERIFFRLRRVNDSVFGYHINSSTYDPDSNPTQEFVRIGSNLAMQPGSGYGISKISISNSSGITAGKSFKAKIHKVEVQSNLSVSKETGNILFSRDFSTDESSRKLITIPLPYNSTTKITSAKLIMKSASTKTVDARLLFSPISNLNLDNIGLFYNLSKSNESTTSQIHHVGSISSGDEISVELLSLIKHFQKKSGHLPGQIKGVIIEIDPSSLSSGLKSFEVENDIKIEYTYEDYTTGVVFQIGVDVNPENGIATFRTKNILYDLGEKSKRTRVNFGVHLKKSGFANKDIEISPTELQRIKYGIGACIDESVLKTEEQNNCFFVVGDTSGGTFVQGPFPCNFYSGGSTGVSSTVEMTVTQSGGLFVFDGNSEPSLNLTEGVTYVFDVSDPSMSGIDLSFKDSGGTKVSSGFTKSGSAGSLLAEVIFKIPKLSGDLKYFDDSGTVSSSGTVYTKSP